MQPVVMVTPRVTNNVRGLEDLKSRAGRSKTRGRGQARR